MKATNIHPRMQNVRNIIHHIIQVVIDCYIRNICA
jgi:hypothetical protein